MSNFETGKGRTMDEVTLLINQAKKHIALAEDIARHGGKRDNETNRLNTAMIRDQMSLATSFMIDAHLIQLEKDN